MSEIYLIDVFEYRCSFEKSIVINILPQHALIFLLERLFDSLHLRDPKLDSIHFPISRIIAVHLLYQALYLEMNRLHFKDVEKVAMLQTAKVNVHDLYLLCQGQIFVN